MLMSILQLQFAHMYPEAIEEYPAQGIVPAKEIFVITELVTSGTVPESVIGLVAVWALWQISLIDIAGWNESAREYVEHETGLFISNVSTVHVNANAIDWQKEINIIFIVHLRSRPKK